MGIFDDVVRDIAKGISSATDAIAHEATEVAKKVADGASSAATTVAGEATEVAKKVADGASSAATSVADEATEVAKKVADGASSAAKTVAGEATEVAKKVADGASSAAKTVADEATEVAKKVADQAVVVAETVASAAKAVIGEASKQIERRKQIVEQEAFLSSLLQQYGDQFPGSDYHPPNRKQWMSGLNPHKMQVNKIVWPGTHDSATNGIGTILITRPFAECQTLSIYDQLVLGTRVLDIRIEKDRNVCHGILISYGIDVVIKDIKKFLSETQSEIIILEVRTEYGHQDPPEFDKYLIEHLGELILIHQDDHVFTKTIAELLPKRIICVWKPRNSPEQSSGSPLWNSGYLKDNWINTDLPQTKFDGNWQNLSQQQPVSERKFFYRVENTATPVPDNPDLTVTSVTGRIHEYARLFINQCFIHGIADRLQIFSIDFIDENFVDACVGLTQARIHGIAA